MEKLKVGDKVVNIKSARWGDETYYDIASVERLTNTMAVLSNGMKVINTPENKYFGEGYCFPLHGDRYTKYELLTPEIEEKAKNEKYRQRIKYWFQKKQFNDEEKKLIYELLKDKDKENENIQN